MKCLLGMTVDWLDIADVAKLLMSRRYFAALRQLEWYATSAEKSTWPRIRLVGSDPLVLPGFVDVSSSTLLSLKKRQSRREERGLVIPNERRATPSGAFSGSTRRAGTIVAFSCVVSRLCRMTTLRFFRRAEDNNSIQQRRT